MELDAFKNAWKDSNENDLITSKQSIMEMIRHKSYGPLASLKKNLELQLMIVPIAIAILVYKTTTHPELLSNVFFWCFCSVGFMIAGYYLVSYLAVLKLENKTNTLKQTLFNQVGTIEKTFQRYFMSTRIAQLLVIALLEILMYNGRVQELDGWQNFAWPLRVLVYAGVIIATYFSTKYVIYRHYGRHLQKIKELLDQLD